MDVADNKLSWKNYKPYFSDKGSNSTKKNASSERHDHN